MNDKFFDLKKEKQDKMINAALKIFSLSDYRRASTDDVVKMAGISKGLLFHYFTNKAGLYDFLYAYSLKYLAIELYQTVSIKEHDYFELLKQIQKAHLLVMKQYPYMAAFLEKAEEETDEEVVPLIAAKRAERKKEYEAIFDRADRNGWKENVNIELATNIIHFTLKGIEHTFVRLEEFIPEEMNKRIEEYLNFLKPAMYEITD
ncbi:MAG: TetR/AcrR family transcriptional regulator [Lachnospiraceae bacterium]|nr:TetR/AcrR family transcriptional regulator [Lachnospiraceae bacterium]